MAEVDTSIYRPQPQQNPFDMITKMGSAADAMGGIAAGQAVQGAMGPDGQIDQNALARLLTQSTAGSMKAIPTLDALQRLKQAGFAADQAGLETFQKRMAITHHLFSGLASKTNPTIADVHEVAARALDPALEASKYGITMPVIMNALKSFRGPDGKPLPSAEIRKKALEIQTQAATTGEILQQHSPQQELVEQGGQWIHVPVGTRSSPQGSVIPKGLPPTTPVYPPEGGAPRLLGPQPPVPGGGVVPNEIPHVPSLVPSRVRTQSFQRPPGGVGLPAPGAPTGPIGANPPGFDTASTGIGGQSAASANELTRANDSSMVRKGMLGNLEDDLAKFASGPGADWAKFAKSAAVRNLPLPESWKERGAVFDVGSIASQEQFNKQAAMLAQQQFAAIGGTGTDSKFESAFTTSPNEALSQLGNKGIIRLLKGNEDAIQAKNKAWQAWRKTGKGPQTYPEFSADFNDHFDPRAFQFKYVEPKERQAYVDAMDEDERTRFLHDLTYARKAGWIRFDQPAAKK